MKSVLAAALAALAGTLLLALPVGAQMRGNSSSQHELGATACNGHGNTNFDRCFCDPGWSGAQCATQESEPNCGAHGKAWYGKCRCQTGWKGAACETAPLVLRARQGGRTRQVRLRGRLVRRCVRRSAVGTGTGHG